MADVKAPAKRSFLKNPIVVTLLISVVVYTYFWSTEPSPTTIHRTHKPASSIGGADADGMTPADYAAHFARYSPSKRDPFQPAVQVGSSVPGSDKGGWELTGINTDNGVTTAVVENKTTSDSAFLHSGDTWNGLKVVSINSDRVTLENALGQDTMLAFPGNNLDDTAAAGGTGGTDISVPSTPPLPALGQSTAATPTPLSLRPLAVPPPPAASTRSAENAGTPGGTAPAAANAPAGAGAGYNRPGPDIAPSDSTQGAGAPMGGSGAPSDPGQAPAEQNGGPNQGSTD